MLAVLDKEFAIDLDHLVPVTVFFVEFDEHGVGSRQALIVNVAGVTARAINADINLLGLMEAVRAIIANG